jgi:hypothetical protein
MTFEVEGVPSGAPRPHGPRSFSREEHGRSTRARPNTYVALSSPPNARRLQDPGPEGAARLGQDSPPNWLCDAIDVIVFAAVLAVVLTAVLGS